MRKFSKTCGQSEANRRMKGQRPNNIRSLYEVLYPFQNQIFEPFVSEWLPLNSWVYHSGSWRLSNCHIQERQKWIFLRCLIFKEFIFPEKFLRNVPPLLLNQIMKINLLSQIIRFQVNAPFRDFLIVITNFLGALSQKEDDFSLFYSFCL